MCLQMESVYKVKFEKLQEREHHLVERLQKEQEVSGLACAPLSSTTGMLGMTFGTLVHSTKL